MSFQSPLLLLTLLALPVAVLLYRAHSRRAERAAAAFANPALLASVAPHRPGWRRHAPYGALRGRACRAGARTGAAGDHGGGSRRAGVDRARHRRVGIDAGDRRAAVATGRGARGWTRVPRRRPARGQGWRGHLQPRRADDRAARHGSSAGSSGPRAAALEWRHCHRRCPRHLAGPRAGDRHTRAPGACRDRAPSDGASTHGRDPLPLADEAARLKVPIYTVALGTDAGNDRGGHPERRRRLGPYRPTARPCAGWPTRPAAATSRPTTARS